MTPKDLRTKTVPEMAGMVERRITDVLILLEQIRYQGDPQTPDSEDDFCNISDFALLIERGYGRVKSSLNELQG